MRHVARTFALATVFVLGGCATESLPQKDDWVVLRGDGTPPEIALVRQKLPSQAIRGRYPVLLLITWTFDSLSDGLPTEAEAQRGKQLSTALDEIIGRDGVFVMSRTVAGARSMYYYVKDSAAHSEDLRRYFDSLRTIEVRITARSEPEWDSVRKVLNGIRN